MGNQQLILYVAATIIVGFILLTLFGVEQRSSEAAIEATRYRAAKQDILNLTEAVEQDFKNIGSYLYKTSSGTFVSAQVDPANAVTQFDTVAVPHVFAFLAQKDSMNPPVPIRYVWEENGETVTLKNGTVRDLFDVERHVNGTLSGFSSTVTELHIDLLPDTTTGVPVTFNLEDTRLIRLSLASVSSLGKGDFVEETRFDAVYRPVPMTITDNAN